MSAAFVFNDGAAEEISFRVANATPVVLVDTTGAQTGGGIRVPRFEVNENSGGTPSLTVDLYNPGTGELRYLAAAGMTYNAVTLTALQSVAFEAGYVISNGWQLRVTSSDAAGKLDVIGIRIGRGRNSV